MLKNDRFYKLFFRIGAKNQSGAKYTFSESIIANRKNQKTRGFISLLAHRQIIANQKCQKNARFYKLSVVPVAAAVAVAVAAAAAAVVVVVYNTPPFDCIEVWDRDAYSGTQL